MKIKSSYNLFLIAEHFRGGEWLMRDFARLCETARLAFFFASPRHFDFLNCETETIWNWKFDYNTTTL